jgi:bifunctional non-homologous end joining protein LigD
MLDDMGRPSVPVTSGSKGIHLYAGLDGDADAEQVSRFAREFAKALEAELPGLAISQMKKELRDGKVFVDWSQNNVKKTTVAPYSLRGRDQPTVAVPRDWAELDDDLTQLTFDQVLDRIESTPDPLLSVAPPPDRLAEYRSMRDRDKTPEPVPADRPPSSDGNFFVIHEHHARRRHWDLRLEHDGVLVSWALPKGVPMSPEQNHLAVQTEDHPMEYGQFEGVIPKGEYGAGEIWIWDTGHYDIEKWRDDEVIAVLHGRGDGGLERPRRIALIQTEAPEKQWLIHLMKDQPR